MTKEDQADSILAAIPWRCFHCDFITMDRAEAEAHFGDRDDAEEFKPICKWWTWMSEDERVQTLQGLIRDLNSEQRENGSLHTAIEGLQYQVGTHAGMFSSYKPFRECRSMHDVFCLYDSMEGRVLVAEKKLELIEKG